MLKSIRRSLGLGQKMRCDFRADGLGVRKREMAFLTEPTFATAWNEAAQASVHGWPKGRVPDIRWRAHTALWAAKNGLMLGGDFVECGVHTGLLSLTICHALDFASVPKRFYLFDTFAGIPLDGLCASETSMAQRLNADIYSLTAFDTVRESFAPFPNAVLVRGALPATLETVPLRKIAYLSIDLNNATAERECIKRLWPMLSPGAFVVIDDYAWAGHRAQYDMWNAFGLSAGAPIVTLPTGQGLIVKPALRPAALVEPAPRDDAEMVGRA